MDLTSLPGGIEAPIVYPESLRPLTIVVDESAGLPRSQAAKQGRKLNRRAELSSSATDGRVET